MSPILEFSCVKCDEQFEALFSQAELREYEEGKLEVLCIKCGHKKVNKKMSLPARPIIKGDDDKEGFVLKDKKTGAKTLIPFGKEGDTKISRGIK